VRNKKISWFSLLVVVALSASLAQCGGGGSLPAPAPAPTATATPNTGTPFTAAGSQTLPSVSGWTPAITIPSGSTPSTGSLGVQVSLSLHSGLQPLTYQRMFAKTPAGVKHIAATPPGSPVTVVDFTLTNTTTSSETLGNVPSVTITAPSGTTMPTCSTPPCVYQAAFDGVPGVSGWDVVGEATLSGTTLTFTPNDQVAIPMSAGATYDLVLYATSSTLSLTEGGNAISNDAITFASPTGSPQTIVVGNGVPPYAAGTPSQSGIVTVAAGSSGQFTITPAGAGTAMIPFTDSAGGAVTLSVTVTPVSTPAPTIASDAGGYYNLVFASPVPTDGAMGAEVQCITDPTDQSELPVQYPDCYLLDQSGATITSDDGTNGLGIQYVNGTVLFGVTLQQNTQVAGRLWNLVPAQPNSNGDLINGLSGTMDAVVAPGGSPSPPPFACTFTVTGTYNDQSPQTNNGSPAQYSVTYSNGNCIGGTDPGGSFTLQQPATSCPPSNDTARDRKQRPNHVVNPC
jgi:hypothetical protein